MTHWSDVFQEVADRVYIFRQKLFRERRIEEKDGRFVRISPTSMKHKKCEIPFWTVLRKICIETLFRIISKRKVTKIPYRRYGEQVKFCSCEEKIDIFCYKAFWNET